MADFRYLLAIYVHAHQTGNSVPPHIDAEARAALAESDGSAVSDDREPTSVAAELSDKELERQFQVWWHNEGSGMPPCADEDQEEHVHRVSQTAWHNSAYCARWGRPAPQPVPVSEHLPGPELCWWYEPDEDDDGSGYGCSWTLLRIRGNTVNYTHWLPAHALPIPEVTNDSN